MHVTKTTVLRMAAFKDGWIPTNTDTQTYIFVNDVVTQPANPAGFPNPWVGLPRPNVPDYYPNGSSGSFPADYQMDPNVVNNAAYSGEIRNDLKTLPTLSIVMDPSDIFGLNGLYTNPEQADGQVYQFGQKVNYALWLSWERPASVELINTDGSTAFQIDAGAQMHGGYSRSPEMASKHPMALTFKDQYGPSKLNYDLFGDSAATKFDSLVLRAGFNDVLAEVRRGQRVVAVHPR